MADPKVTKVIAKVIANEINKRAKAITNKEKELVIREDKVADRERRIDYRETKVADREARLFRKR